ncbi:MAG: formyltransferase family protein [Nitrospirota bacterium]
MRVIFIGSVESSRRMLEKLLHLRANIVGVVTQKSSAFNADFADLTDICEGCSIPYRYVEKINERETIQWIERLLPDVIFCFGFSQLLNNEVLGIAPMGVIGFHPAKLPQNRGRHPIIWALALGLEKTASTFFFMSKDADDGDILSQVDIEITYEDNARTLYDKIISAALIQIETFLPKLYDKTFRRTSQDRAQANYWRKRIKKDGEIDFRMCSRTIYNLVRALTKPYVGAHVVYKGHEVRVWDAREVQVNLSNIEHGKVINVAQGQVLVKCADNAILLITHEFEGLPIVGEYLQ